MLKEFSNNKMSSNDVDSMMEDFFEQKEEKEFRKKWNKILDEEKQEYKIIKFFRNHMYATVSAASIILMIGFGGIYYTSNYINSEINYSEVTKGNSAMKIKLNSLMNKQSVIIGINATNETKSVWELYKNNQFEKVISSVDSITKFNTNIVSNEILWMAGLSAIKTEDYSKAKSHLTKIDNESTYFQSSKDLLKIIDDILE